MAAKKKISIARQKRDLKKFILNTPVEEILPNKNKKAVEVLRRAGLVKDDDN